MTYMMRELIKKKRDQKNLEDEEIQWIIKEYTNEQIPDYQMSALLMAIFNKGMNTQESVALTQAMVDSGRTLDLSDIDKPKVDKHSTGGVGDKTSMILAPIVAASDVCVPMMSGRGLGHTGGTLDKLESIPGFQTTLDEATFKKYLKEMNVAMIGQTKDICPADKKLYALRDVTATVESIPLICASIMSKKIAEGIDGLVLDVKFGSGAFMKNIDHARILAQSLKNIGEGAGKEVTALLSNMNQVLGRYVGNAVEIKECLEILKDPSSHEKYKDTVELSLALSANMLLLAKTAQSYEKAYEIAKENLHNGKAFEVFERLCQAQGGKLKDLPEPYPAHSFLAQEEGYIHEINSENIGIAGILLKAGRQKVDDKIDPRSGFEVHVKVGDYIHKGEALCSIFAKDESEAKATHDLLQSAFRIAPATIKKEKLVVDTLMGG